MSGKGTPRLTFKEWREDRTRTELQQGHLSPGDVGHDATAPCYGSEVWWDLEETPHDVFPTNEPPHYFGDGDYVYAARCIRCGRGVLLEGTDRRLLRETLKTKVR